jgi:hypothetical protein
MSTLFISNMEENQLSHHCFVLIIASNILYYLAMQNCWNPDCEYLMLVVCVQGGVTMCDALCDLS